MHDPLENKTPDTGRSRDPAGSPPSKTPWNLLILLMVMTGIAPLSLNILVPAVPHLAASLAADAGTVQLTVSLFLVGLAASQLIMGPLSDRFGRRPVVLAGLGIAVAVSLVSMFAQSVTHLIALRIVQALGASAGIVIGRAMIRDLFERDRAAAMLGLVATAMTIAPMVAPAIGGVIDTALGWHAIFLFVGCLTAAVLVWAAFRLPETRVHIVGTERARFRADAPILLRSKSFVGYALCAGAGSAPFFAMVGGAPYVVVEMMGRTSAEYGVWFAVAAFGYMAGNFTVSRLSMRFGVDAMVWWGLLAELTGAAITLALVLLFPKSGPAVIFVPHILISFGNGVLLPNAIAGAVSVRPLAAGTAAGLSGFIQMSMAAATNQISGTFMAGATTPVPLVVAVLLLPLIGVFSVLFLIRPSNGAV